MNTYKLKYEKKQAALADLLSKGVLIESDRGIVFGSGIHAVVELGTYFPEHALYEQVDPLPGYHYDVVSEHQIAFDSAIQVANPKHTFL